MRGRLMSEEELSHRKHTKPNVSVTMATAVKAEAGEVTDELVCLLVALKTVASLEL